MSAGQESYDRLMAARRIISAEEREVMEKEAAHARQNARIRRKLPKVY